MMETEKILPFEKNGKILKYVKYVDDVFICCDKNLTEKILKNMNSFHSQLQFTKQKLKITPYSFGLFTLF